LIVAGLDVDGFRNIFKRQLIFSPRRNLIFGSNGVGKTSVLETVFLAAFGKSFLNARLIDLIPRGDTRFGYRIKTARQESEREIVCFSQGKRLDIELDGERAQTAAIREVLYPVFFSSTSYTLEVESVPHMRRTMNRFICGVDSLYIHYILSYNQALKQKNHLLRFAPREAEISGWNRVLSETGTRVVKARDEFVSKLNQEIRNQGKEEMKIIYSPSIAAKPECGIDAFKAELDRVRDIEYRNKRSVLGPHRDRFDIRLSGVPLRLHSSGEKKLHLLLAYIAFIKIFKKINGDFPVFLVDDYDTAMDNKNVQVFMDAYPDMQVIATSVNPNGRFDRQIELAREN